MTKHLPYLNSCEILNIATKIGGDNMTKKINNSCNIDPDFKNIPFQNGKDLKGVELYILGKKDQQIYLRNLPLSFHDHLLEMYQNSDLCYVYVPIETVLKNLSKEEQEEIKEEE